MRPKRHDPETVADFSDKIMQQSIDRDKTAGNADCNNITEDMR